MTEHDEIVKQFREQQYKYVYYIIALCVAGIGFAIQKTMNVPLSKPQVLLGVSVASLSLSIYCGLRFLHFQIASLYNNSELLKIQAGTHELTGNHPQKIAIGIEAFKKIFENASKKTMRLGKWQNRWFYLGIISFVAWRVWEMYLITEPIK